MLAVLGLFLEGGGHGLDHIRGRFLLHGCLVHLVNRRKRRTKRRRNLLCEYDGVASEGQSLYLFFRSTSLFSLGDLIRHRGGSFAYFTLLDN